MSSEIVRRHKDRGALLLSKGKLGPALEEFQRVVAAVPGELGSRQKVAEILARLGRKAESIAEYRRVVDRYADQGQFFKATALCKVILTLDPMHVQTQESLAKLYSARRPSPAPQVIPPRTPATPPLEPGALLTRPPPAPPPDEELEIAIDLAEEIPIEVELPAPVRSSLPVIPLFSDLSREEFVAMLSTALEVRAFDAGDQIVVEGQPGHSMFAIAEGQVGVLRTVEGQPPRRVAQLNEGDFFGEMALLSDSPRLATVIAESPTVLLELSRESLTKIIAAHPAVGAALERFYRDRLLANLLRSSPLLRPLSEEQKQAVAQHFQSRTCVNAETIIEDGQTSQAVYLLLRGVCRVFHRDEARKAVRYPDLREGDSFGEISVVREQPASASVEASGPVVVLWLPAKIFRELVLSHPDVQPMVLDLVNERLERTSQLVSRPESASGDLRI